MRTDAAAFAPGTLGPHRLPALRAVCGQSLKSGARDVRGPATIGDARHMMVVALEAHPASHF